ncbi:hypothetical protein GFY24_36805 [Nocardia sp. SYP-A9097]|uniref:hypothetical protein n=1 Tax=Nocardia sp. SYP-A9097 TaxID=2663237 RepID=UPI00129B4C9C|nr:hypothetical protein [Nocardia sp. SYP-A9097]MRH92917.1 hypothetical protein [Nocardia sp. SYP-A9097]
MSDATKDHEPKGYHEEPSVVQLHRAIGGYVTIFSELIAQMRRDITTYFEPVTVEHSLAGNPLLDVLFASMTAKPIVEAFSLSARLARDMVTM